MRHRQSLAEVARLIANAEGQLQAETERKSRLEREVGEAKGRRERNPVYSKFLEEMQADAHSRNVGKFERLLTTLVNEIMPGQPPIGLDLAIKRGQPALDIVSRVTADLSKDIYKHKGGALTNVVVLGLRMIALVRSRKRRFLILDESDCWTQSEKIPAFYNVVRDAAAKLGIQCIAISHWPTDKYGEGVNVARLSGHPEAASGTNINNSPRRHAWDDSDDGFRYVRLINFQGYVDETLYLTPGMTVISGDNDLGKSSFGRAMRAICYGDIDDGLIRDGERMCAVEIGLKGGRVLRWDRQLKRNPINLWKLMEPDGSVVTVTDEDGQIVQQYETGGDVPAWVEKEFGVTKVQGLDVHLMLQKEPVFLLNESAQVRATVLSVGQESNYISTMIQKHKEQVALDSATIREGEKEMSRIIDRIGKLESALTHAENLREAEALHDLVVKQFGHIEAMETKLDGIVDAIDVMRRLEERLETLAYLPDTDDLRSLEQSIRQNQQHSEIAASLEEAASALARGRALAQVLSDLPSDLPKIRTTDNLIVLGKNIATAVAEEARLRTLRDHLENLPQALPEIRSSAREQDLLDKVEASEKEHAAAEIRLADAESRMKAVEIELNGIVEELGHACPVCGSHLEGGHRLMAGHTHGEAA